jgi:cation:H+ antiporter
MLLPIGGLLAGFVLLIWSADRFVIGASASARIFGVSPLLIGVLVVGFGTSAPEMLVSAMAAMDGQPGLAIGNALGSNIANIGLILGLTALLYPLRVRSRIVKREIPLLLLFMFIGVLMLLDGELNRGDGLILLSGLFAMVGWSIHEARQNRDDILAQEFESETPVEMSATAAVATLLMGLLVLMASSRLLVWSATEIATALGVSDLLIGLTIVALGTSLPELAASIAAARKGEHDIAIGNIAGSNMFNLLGVLALPGIIAPGAFDPAILNRDYPAMVLLTVLLWIFASDRRSPLRKGGMINRIEASVFLIIYFAYMGLLFYQSTLS